jgi:HSP90 family molecular chaperone
MRTTTSHRNEPTVTEAKLSLQIANPAAILNAIASRYESSTRILMEYVDNSLDCAEEMTRAAEDVGGERLGEGGGGGVQVHVAIDHAKRAVWVRDNCAGMSPNFLVRHEWHRPSQNGTYPTP